MMEPIKIHCKKDFRGLVDVRDHVVKLAINEGRDIVITCGSFPGKSTYSPEELQNPVAISQPFTARHGNIKTYRLHSYAWKI